MGEITVEGRFLVVGFQYLVNCRVREEHLFVRGGARRTSFWFAAGQGSHFFCRVR